MLADHRIIITNKAVLFYISASNVDLVKALYFGTTLFYVFINIALSEQIGVSERSELTPF